MASWMAYCLAKEGERVILYDVNLMFPRESGLGNNPVSKYGTIFSEGNDDEIKKDVQPRVQT